MQVGLFGLGEQGPAEESPTAGMPKPADNKSTEPPEPFKGQPDNTQMKVQGEKSETQKDSTTGAEPSPTSYDLGPGSKPEASPQGLLRQVRALSCRIPGHAVLQCCVCVVKSPILVY